MGNSRRSFSKSVNLEEELKSAGVDFAKPLIIGEGSTASCAKESRGVNSPDKNKSAEEILSAYNLISVGLLSSLDKSIKKIYAR